MSDDPRTTPLPATRSDDAPTGQIRQPTILSIEVAGDTDKGMKRPGNEDNLIFEGPNTPAARAQGTLLVVSDGMGGHAAGEVASDIAVNTIHGTFYQHRGMPTGEAVHDAIVTANTAIYEAAQRNVERAGMGCTVVVLVVQGADLTIGHVGDSRAYLIRDGVATQLTLDHSWVAMQVHEGILTPEQAEHHPNRSVLMRALGRYPAVEVDISTRKLRAGDVLIVCSDGLTGMVTDAEIAEYAGRFSPQALPRQLIELANSRGAPDNVTVVVGAIVGGPAAAAGAADPNTATTVISAPHDARTPHLDPATGDTPTDRNLPRPKPDATVPLGLGGPGQQRRPSQQPAAPATPKSGPATPPGGVVAPPGGPASAPTARTPRGKPVVVARASVPEPSGPAGRTRRGRGQWIAGAVAAFGLAGALLLLVAFQGGVFGTSSTASTSTGVAAQPPAATPVPRAPADPPAPAAAPPAPPAATPPPPAATTNPSILLPAPAAATPVSPGAASKPAATIVPTPASSPGATNPTPTLAIPAIPTIRSLFGTPAPTATPGQRTGEAPATSADAPSASGPGPGGAPSTTTDPSTAPSTDEGQPAETAPEGAAPEPAPGAASEGGRNSDLCARGAQIAPGLAARAGCKPSNSND